MTPAELAEIEARERKATRGPWEHEPGSSFIGLDGESLWDHVHGLPQLEDAFHPEDAEFIAHAREDVPRMAAEIRRLWAELHDRRTADRQA